MVVCVEEGPVADEGWHFKPLMHNLEAALLVDGHNGHFVVIHGDDLLVVLEELDELVRHDAVHSHLANREGFFFVPLLQHDQLLHLVFVDNGNLSLLIQQLLCFDEKFLLNLHSALLRLRLHDYSGKLE